MPRIPAVAPESAHDRERELLDATRRRLGIVPNLYATMARSPATLEGYLNLRDALGTGTLSAPLREQLSLLIAHENACGYCVAAHVRRSSKMGFSDETIRETQHARSDDAHTAAILMLAREVVRMRGIVDDAVLQAARDSGVTDSETIEVVGHVALNVLANYVNHVAAPDLDFPEPHAGQVVG